MNATPESVRAEADKSLRLAGQARRMAELLQQPDIKQQMMAQERLLEHAAGELEKLAWRYERPGEQTGEGESLLAVPEAAALRCR